MTWLSFLSMRRLRRFPLTTILVSLAALTTIFIFLFGDNVIFRSINDNLSWPSKSTNGRRVDETKTQTHSAYSFDKHPFIHPRIVGDLVGYMSDAGDQVVAINLLDSQDSNRYYGEIHLAAPANTTFLPYPWVYSAKHELAFNEEPAYYFGIAFDAYRYIGTTSNGLYVIHKRQSGGGAGVFNRLLFVAIEMDYSYDYPLSKEAPPSREGIATPALQPRENVKLVGRILLGDRWYGTIEVIGDEIVVRGRDLYERCKVGGTSVMEIIEMKRFMDTECKKGKPKEPPEARVFRAPDRT